MIGGRTDMQRGGVIWITGLSGVGKTSLAIRVAERLRSCSLSTIVLDGDALREALGESGLQGGIREQLALRYSRLAWLVAGQGSIAVVATISLLHSVHDYNRRQSGQYLEVLLEIPSDLRLSRSGDRNGGPRVGIEIDAEMPLAPHLKLTNNANPNTLDELALRVVDAYGSQHDPVSP
jgi:cytidine diphosphoramidate kinase